MSNKRLYFKNLDSIRFIAALMVFLQHGMRQTFESLASKGTFLSRFFTAISSGGAGVSIFFVLSGFLITYLLITEYEEQGKITIKNFYIRRILRIWPLYYAVVIFSFFLYPLMKSFVGMSSDSQSKVFYFLTFLSNFDVINIQKYCSGQDVASQNVTWSVSVEEQFYLFWPLLFTFLPRRAWIYAISAVIIGSLTFRILHNADGVVLYFHTFSVLMDLGIGGLFAYAIKNNLRIRTFFESTSTLTHAILFAVFFILLIWGDLLFSFSYAPALGRVAFSLCFVMIIASQAMTTRDSVLNLGKFSFANRWGKYTYGIYLIHPIALTFVEISMRVAHIKSTAFPVLLGTGIAGFILTLLMSWVSYEFFESRFLALKDKFAVIKSH